MEILRKIFKKKPKKIKEVLPIIEDKILVQEKTFQNKTQRELSELRKEMKEANNKLLGKN